jgi:diacylglycerol O-acyltransferase / wax synthase
VRCVDRLNPIDTSFLNLERDIPQLHVGSVMIFAGPAPSYESVVAEVEAKLAKVPRYRQQVRRVPLELARPVWVDDPHFNIHYHIRHTALPAPGGEEQLRTLAARLMSQRLDLARPLWEMYLVEGLSGGRWALVNKAHHAMIDGVSGHDIMSVMLDRTPDTRSDPGPGWTPEPEPGTAGLLAGALLDQVRDPAGRVRAMAGALRAPRRFVQETAAHLAGLRHYGETWAKPENVLNGPIGPHRRWCWARAELAAAKEVKDTFGGTVNDVVLTAVAGGFRTFLAARGEDVTNLTVRTMVPVSMRTQEQAGTLGNQVSAFFADLPVNIADPVERLRAVTAQLDGLKRSGAPLGARTLSNAAEFVPPTLLALAARAVARIPQRAYSTVITNVPGPQRPLYLLGRELMEMFPYIPLATDLRITVGIFSYNGRLDTGVTGDYDQVPDLGVLCAGIEAAMVELVEAGRAA